jgi:hypothetical protein
MPLPIIIVNGWGYLDAVLRFPVVHELESFFTVKNLLLLAFKVALLAFGFRHLDRVGSACCMLSLMVANLMGLPALYLIALPIDDSQMDQRMAAHDVVDVDLAQSMLRFATSSEHRKDSLTRLKKRLRLSSQKILEMPMMTEVVEALSPRHRKPLSPSQRKSV